jgi:Ser/Thr protein kinase RdoA (MazF antagonist)
MLSKRILEAYGITETQLLPVAKGYRNASHAAVTSDGTAVNVIIYKREPDMLATVKRANLVGDYLAAQGFPARRTLDTRIIRISHGTQEQYAALYEYLPSSTIPWDAYTMHHLKQLGAVMSTMHHLLKAAPFRLDNQVTDEYLAVVSRMQQYFADPGVEHAMHAKLKMAAAIPQRFSSLLVGCARLPNTQTLHMDFVRGNILFDDTARITGVLDFEKTAWGHPLIDIARTLTFLLIDCKYKTEMQVRKYFLLSGYNKHGAGTFKITAKNSQLLEELVDLFLFYDFYKFLRHNPYESLPRNEHFMRTRALLLQRRLLASTSQKPHTTV